MKMRPGLFYLGMAICAGVLATILPRPIPSTSGALPDHTACGWLYEFEGVESSSSASAVAYQIRAAKNAVSKGFETLMAEQKLGCGGRETDVITRLDDLRTKFNLDAENSAYKQVFRGTWRRAARAEVEEMVQIFEAAPNRGRQYSMYWFASKIGRDAKKRWGVESLSEVGISPELVKNLDLQ